MSPENPAAWSTLQLPAGLTTLAAADSIRPPGDATLTAPVTPPESAAAEVSLDLADLPTLTVAEEQEGSEGAELVLTGRLGEGGMGVVHRAWQRSLGREVAVKRIRDRHRRPAAVRALLTESRITGSLEHPNIVPIHAVGRDPEGNPALVMKRVEGVPLSELVRDVDHPGWTALPADRPRWYLETLMQVCHAVELAHSRGVIHRDLKLDNVMVGAFGEVYVLDWGIALPLPAGQDHVPSVSIAGTPACMAPEMVRGGPIDRRTDVYLLGAMLHEILTGSPRHAGATLGAAMRSILASEPVVYQGIPEELAGIANQATAADPDARFPSVRDFREALVRFLEHRESAALSEEADRLRASANPHEGERRTQLTAVRSVYAQALSRWPGNHRATAGLHATIRELFHLELAQGHREAAAALLAELPNSDGSLERALRALDTRIAADRSHVAELERMAEDHDPATRPQDRRTGLLAMTLVAGLTMLAVLGVRWLGWLDPDHGLLFATALATAAVALLAMVATRIGRSSEVNRRLGWSVTAVIATAPFARGAAWWLDVPVPQMLAFELLGYALATALIGIGVHGSFLVITPLIAAGFGATLLLPTWALEIATTVMLASMILVLWLWSREAGPEG